MQLLAEKKGNGEELMVLLTCCQYQILTTVLMRSQHL